LISNAEIVTGHVSIDPCTSLTRCPLCFDALYYIGGGRSFKSVTPGRGGGA